jgi:hypothetical protein
MLFRKSVLFAAFELPIWNVHVRLLKKCSCAFGFAVLNLRFSLGFPLWFDATNVSWRRMFGEKPHPWCGVPEEGCRKYVN